MLCALVLISGFALFFAGMIAGAALLILLERDPPSEALPPVCDDP